jgi:hypothetical protein
MNSAGTIVFGFVLVCATSRIALSADSLLVVLADTGKIREGHPVLMHHQDEAAISGILSRGFSGRILRLYRLEQTYLERAAGIRPEPAYLLFSKHQGGFPRFGFYLNDEDKRHVGYVNLYQTKRLTGQFVSDDQVPNFAGGMTMECMKDRNRRACNCSYEPCARKGKCCDCLSYHRLNRELPACFFPAAAELTYDRSFEHFARLLAAGKV